MNKNLLTLTFAQMPLAADRRLEARLAQGAGQRAFRQRQTPRCARSHDGVNSRPHGITTGHEGGARGRAYRLPIESLEHRPLAGEFVERGRADFLAAGEARVRLAEIIGEDEEEVRLGGRSGEAGHGGRDQGQGQNKIFPGVHSQTLDGLLNTPLRKFAHVFSGDDSRERWRWQMEPLNELVAGGLSAHRNVKKY